MAMDEGSTTTNDQQCLRFPSTAAGRCRCCCVVHPNELTQRAADQKMEMQLPTRSSASAIPTGALVHSSDDDNHTDHIRDDDPDHDHDHQDEGASASLSSYTPPTVAGELSCGARLNARVRRWTSTFSENVQRCGQHPHGAGAELPPMMVMVFQLRQISWIAKYVTFYRIHATYFLTLGSLGTLVIYVIPLSNSKRLGFVDAAFTAFSAACGTGLQSVRSPDLTRLHYLVILVLLNLGAPVLVSLLPLYTRRFYFYLCIKQCCAQQDVTCRSQQQQPPSRSSHRPRRLPACSSNINGVSNASSRSSMVEDSKVGFAHQDDDPELALPRAQDLKQIDQAGQQPPERVPHSDGDHQLHNGAVADAADMTIQHQKKAHHHRDDIDQDQGSPSEKWKISVDSKRAMKTLEYRALVALSWTVICYFFGSQIIGFVLGSLYFLGSPHDAAVVKQKDINPTFFTLFTAVSTFTNAGYNVNNDSMLSFPKSTLLLLLYAVLASIGNTMYAPVLRLLVWIRYLLVDEKNPDKLVYDYLLCHPRRCFTNLFPRSQTIWLVVIFFAFTTFPMLLLCKLEWNEALDHMTAVEKLVAGIYQIVGTRNGGGTVVQLHRLTPALLVIFMMLMYISAYPLFLSLQTSNDDYDHAELAITQNYRDKINPDQWESILVVQSRRLLARDSSYLFFAILFLCLSENRSIKSDPLNYSIFNIVFEVISAYGSVGLSLGYHCDLQMDKTRPCENVPYSFSGTWTSVGKLILVFVMFCGRHRGLPDDIDPAIRLPTKFLAPTMPETPEKRCEEFVTELALRMHPQLQPTQRVSTDIKTTWMGPVQDV